MSLAASMLDDDALRAGDDGFELDVHLNWYRSLPLSSVHTVDLTVNGETIPREEITFSSTATTTRSTSWVSTGTRCGSCSTRDTPRPSAAGAIGR